MTQFDSYAVQRVARAATDQGHYNLAKLLNAALASIANQSLSAESLPKTNRALAEAVAEIEPLLIAANVDRRLLDLIQHARAIIAADQLILHVDAPAVFVCRSCGAVAFETAPAHCERCGAGPLIYQAFPAAFYLEPLPVPEVLAQLARTPDWLDALLEGVSEAQAAQITEGAEGAWSLLEAAGHLLDSQDLIAQRVRLFMQHEAPDLATKAVWEMVESAGLTARQIALNFRQSRAALLGQLAAATPAHWARLGRHAEFGPVTLQQQCGYFAKHEQWHMAQMTRLKHAVVR